MRREHDEAGEADLAALREAEAEFRAAFEAAPDLVPSTSNLVDVAFDGEVIVWRGPAPYYFVRLPAQPAAAVHAVSGIATYGWGCIPVDARIRDTEFGTALIPREGGYM